MPLHPHARQAAPTPCPNNPASIPMPKRALFFLIVFCIIMINGYQITPHVHVYAVSVEASVEEHARPPVGFLDGYDGANVAILCPEKLLETLHLGFLSQPKACTVSVYTNSSHAGRDAFFPAGATAGAIPGSALPLPLHRRHPHRPGPGVNFTEIAAKVPSGSVFDTVLVVYTHAQESSDAEEFAAELRAVQALGSTTVFVSTDEFRQGFASLFTRFQVYPKKDVAEIVATTFRACVFANVSVDDVVMLDVTMGAYHDPFQAVCHCLYGSPPTKARKTQNVEIPVGVEILAVAPLDVADGRSTMRVATNKVVLDVPEGHCTHLVVITSGAPQGTAWPTVATEPREQGISLTGLGSVSWPIARGKPSNIPAIEVADFSRLAKEYVKLRKGETDDPLDAVTFFLREQYRVRRLQSTTVAASSTIRAVSTVLDVYGEALNYCVKTVAGFAPPAKGGGNPNAPTAVTRHASNW